MDANGAAKYLEHHLKKSLSDDFGRAYHAFFSPTALVGFFALPRMLFPYITFLGTLYRGKDDSQNAVAFIVDYLGRFNPSYQDIGDIIYYVFRHGLIHTNMPKVMRIAGRDIGWAITYRDVDHLKLSPLGLKDLNIYFSPRPFYFDILCAIDQYVEDLCNPQYQRDLLENFKSGFIRMARFHEERETLSRCSRGIQHLRSLLP